MRRAAIDIGTNTVLLLITEYDAAGDLVVVNEQATITRLGQGVDNQKRINPKAIKRTLAALSEYKQTLQQFGVNRWAVVGTSALRDATNADDFLTPATLVMGCPIEVVSGTREATLVRLGVTSALGALPVNSVIFDVGGGSTEFIETDGRCISLNIGTVRLTERHITSDPPTENELAQIHHTVAHALETLPFKRPIGTLVGVAGTVTTLVTINREMATYDSSRVNGAELTTADIDRLSKKLSTTPLKQRQTNIVGLEPGRADVIIAGVVLVQSVMQHFGVDKIVACDRGVRWGLLLEQG